MSGQQMLDREGRCVHWRQRIVTTESSDRYVCFDCGEDRGECGMPPVTEVHVDISDYPAPVTNLVTPVATVREFDADFEPPVPPWEMVPRTQWAGPRAALDGKRPKGGVLPYVDTRSIHMDDDE